MKIFEQLENGQLVDEEGCVYDCIDLPKETWERIFKEMDEEYKAKEEAEREYQRKKANYENTK